MAALSRRWDMPVSCVVAGAGYGKSTTLLAALDGSNDKAHDRFLALGAETAAEELVGALADCWGLGAPPSTLGEAVVWLVSSWWALSPNSVCTTVDNAHHLDAQARVVLATLISGLKPNTHLLIAGRSQVLDGAPVLLDEQALRFNDEEIAIIALKTGTTAAELAIVQGWPAAIAVTIAARGLTTSAHSAEAHSAEAGSVGTGSDGAAAVEVADTDAAPTKTLWSAILSPLTSEQRSAVALLALAGPSDERTLERLLGDQADELVNEILSQVPLCVWRRGFMDVHVLWGVPALASLSAVDRRAIPIRVVRALLDGGRASEAFVLATEYGLSSERLRIVQSVCADERLIPDAATAARWVSMIGDADVTFETDLLRGIFLKGREPRLAVEHLRRAADSAGAANQPRIEMMALALLGTVGYTLQDDGVRQHIALRARELGAEGNDDALVLVDLGEVFRFLEVGDPRSALQKLDAARIRTADQFSSLAAYLRALALCEVGQAQAALEQLAMHEGALRPYQFGSAIVAARCRWMIGDLDGAEALLEREAASATADQRADHASIFDAFRRLIAAVTGRATGAEATPGTTPISMLLFACAQTLSSIEVDPSQFGAVLQLAHSFGGLGSVLPELRHLAWFVAPDFPQPELDGPVEAARRAGRAIANDELPSSGDAERSLHLFPRPIIIRLTLLWLRRNTTGERPSWATSLRPADRSDARHAARELGLTIPGWLLDPEQSVEIRVLGPISISVGGIDQPPELRRERVRALLWLLVFRSDVSRREAASLLWPKLSPEASANNLRTTLGYLVKVFDGNSKVGGSSILAVDRVTIGLRRDVALSVDAWELQKDLDAARRAERTGAISQALQLYRAAAGHWRADPGNDLDTDEWSNRAIGELRAAFVEASVRAAELLIGFDDGEALRLAVGALMVDRWSARASDVEVRANSGLGRDAAARQALIRHRSLLAELGIDASRSEPLAGVVSRATLGRR